MVIQDGDIFGSVMTSQTSLWPAKNSTLFSFHFHGIIDLRMSGGGPIGVEQGNGKKTNSW